MKNSALVVIDLQNDITKNYREIIENVNEAIDWAVKKELWVIYIQHNNLSAGTRTFRPGTRGAELVPELNVVSDHIFTKSKSNALTSKAFSAFLQERGITEVYEAPRLTPQKLVNSVLCFRFQYDSCAWQIYQLFLPAVLGKAPCVFRQYLILWPIAYRRNKCNAYK